MDIYVFSIDPLILYYENFGNWLGINHYGTVFLKIVSKSLLLNDRSFQNGDINKTISLAKATFKYILPYYNVIFIQLVIFYTLYLMFSRDFCFVTTFKIAFYITKLLIMFLFVIYYCFWMYCDCWAINFVWLYFNNRRIFTWQRIINNSDKSCQGHNNLLQSN